MVKVLPRHREELRDAAIQRFGLDDIAGSERPILKVSPKPNRWIASFRSQ